MKRNCGQVPEISDEIKAKWAKSNGYPCGHFEKCEFCHPGISICTVWNSWFQTSWRAIRHDANMDEKNI